jgi:hypothetical protein
MFHFITNKASGVFFKKSYTPTLLTKSLVTTIVLLLMTLKVGAQQKTVEGSLQILPPFPIQLQSYTNPLNDNIKLSVTLNGLWENGQTPVKLRLVLEKGNSIIAQSDNIGALVGATTVNLFPNVTYTFTSGEIAPYFALNNLQGINAATYNSPLTEGVYRLSFLVYNATNGKLISDAISQQFWVIQNEPPLLNTPRTGDNVKNELTTPINFQWIPRALQTVGRTEYEFTLVNISAANADNPYAQFIVKQQAPLFRRTVSTPAISATPAELLLEAGKTYAWRVRARSLDFLNNEIASYKNDGYSDIFTFRYNGTCVKPTGLKLVAKSGDMVAATWTPNAKHLSYRVAYRKYADGQNWKWLEQATANTFTNLTQLEPNTEYQVTVGGLCAENFLTYSDTLRVRTLDSSQIQGVTCGQILPTDLSNRTPIASLAIGDSIKAGDFTVMITRIAGGAGNFTGQGYVKVPWMGDTKLKVLLKNISVNTDKKLIGGYIETAYDPEWKNITDVETVVEEIKAFFDLIQNLIDTAIENSRINDIVEEIKKQIEQNLPPELVASLNAALADMKDAKAAYEAAKLRYDSLPPGPEKDQARQEMDAAKAKFNQAKETLKQVQSLKDQLIKDAANIIRLALKAILQDYNDNKEQTSNKLNQSTTNLTQAFPSASLEPVSDLTSMEGVASANSTTPLSENPFLSPDEKTLISAYLADEFAVNRLEVAKLFATSLDNDADAAKLANELKKDGKDLGKYVYERKQANIPQETIVIEVKEILYKKIENILIVKIYKQ